MSANEQRSGSPEATVSRAIEWCEQHLALPRQPMLSTRRMARASLQAVFEESLDTEIESFLEVWFHDDTQRALKALV